MIIKIEPYSEIAADLYEKIHCEKDYEVEAQFINSVCDEHWSPDNSKRTHTKTLLDFGCGTGIHLLYLRDYVNFGQIVGYEPSFAMYKKALERHINSNCLLVNDTYNIPSWIDEEYPFFDIVTSLFYVVNHITSLKELESTFSFISNKLRKNGLFIFDCWNAIVNIKDPPYESVKYIDHPTVGEVIYKNTPIPETDEKFNMKCSISYGKCEYEYTLQNRIWTPDTIKDILKYCGFEIVKIYKTYKLESIDSKDRNMVYVCRKVKTP